jgi:hypothetical protein
VPYSAEREKVEAPAPRSIRSAAFSGTLAGFAASVRLWRSQILDGPTIRDQIVRFATIALTSIFFAVTTFTFALIFFERHRIMRQRLHAACNAPLHKDANTRVFIDD